jgi:hypothetical protein
LVPLADGETLIPPPVPGTTGGSGTTVVHTPSLDTFASNMGMLVSPVKNALSMLQAMPPVAPGQFYHAYQIEDKVDGTGGTGGLVSSYTSVLNELADGLTSIQSAATAMSKKYTTIDELNNAKVSDLDNDFDTAQSEFGSMMTANGGTASTGGTSDNGGNTGNNPPKTNSPNTGGNTGGNTKTGGNTGGSN